MVCVGDKPSFTAAERMLDKLSLPSIAMSMAAISASRPLSPGRFFLEVLSASVAAEAMH